MCFGALSFLLEIPKTVHQFHVAIDAVFDQVDVTFAEIAIWNRADKEELLDFALRRYTHQVLIKFVDLCAACIRLGQKGKWHSFLKKSKWVLSDENPIKSDLDEFKALLESRERLLLASMYHQGSQMRGDLRSIQKTTGKTGKAVRDLLESNQAQDVEKTRHGDLKTIRERLGIDSHSQASSDNVHRDGLNKASPRSTWFQQLKEYTDRIEQSAPNFNPMLLLAGDQGSGKTHVATSVFLSLKDAKPISTHQDEQTLIAYHSFPSPTNKADDDKRPLETAFKCMACQLAGQHLKYRKTLLGLCEKNTFDSKTCKDLWSDFQFEKPRAKATFLLFDGVDNLAEQDIRELFKTCKTVRNGHLRQLMTGTKQCFLRESVPLIQIENHTQQELKGYIERCLKEADLLQDDRQYFVDLRRKICDRLFEQSSCSFLSAQKLFLTAKEFIQTDEKDKLDQFLDYTSKDSSALAHAQRQQLEEGLNDKHIDELNILLVWIEYGREWLDTQQLEAALVCMRLDFIAFQVEIELIMLVFATQLGIAGATSQEDPGEI